MFEWDETVAFDENASMIGRIGATKEKEVELDGLPKEYWQYKELFTNEKGEMLAPRQTFDHAIDIKEGATPPWRPIYPMSAYQLEEQNKNLCKMLPERKNSSQQIPGQCSHPLCTQTRRQVTVMRGLPATQ